MGVLPIASLVVALGTVDAGSGPLSCGKAPKAAREPGTSNGAKPDPLQSSRDEMVNTQIAARGIRDERVLRALREEPRHLYVPEARRHLAYGDHPLPIGHDQTISQPYIVARMTEALELRPGDKVLEIGTGSGYQAAILGRMGMRTYSIEIVAPLCRSSREILDRLGHNDVQTRCGDGHGGWPGAAPFDAILVTAAPEAIPTPLIDQLSVGGRMVIPLGGGQQWLLRLRKGQDGTLHRETLDAVRFVPMTGKARGTTRAPK